MSFKTNFFGSGIEISNSEMISEGYELLKQVSFRILISFLIYAEK